MYHFNKRSYIRSKVFTINLFKKNSNYLFDLQLYVAVSTLNFCFEVNFWMRMIYFIILKLSNSSKRYIFQVSYQFLF